MSLLETDNKFYKTAAKYKPMSINETKKLIHDKNYKKIIENNIGLAYSWALQSWNSNATKGSNKKYKSGASVNPMFTISLDDLVQEAIVGLIYAVTRYDPELGYRFSTYATYWIKRSIRVYINKNASLLSMPHEFVQDLKKHLYEKNNNNDLEKSNFKYKRANIEKMTEYYGKALNVNHENTRNNRDNEIASTLNASSEENAGILSQHMLTAIQGIDNVHEANDRKKKLRVVLKTKLTEQEYFVISEYYGFAEDEPRLDTYDKIAEILGVSKEYVRLIHNAAIFKLKKIIKNPENWD